MNHSCDANLYYREGTWELVARRDIKSGEDLTYDYCMTDFEYSLLFPQCYCGTDMCRQQITGYESVREQVIEQYGDCVSPFILSVHQKIRKYPQEDGESNKDYILRINDMISEDAVNNSKSLDSASEDGGSVNCATKGV
eukprot:TRINITY_DN2065_c0_g3_i1.p1 TRINITY_DN2065_c0_g3~~TRINITY_DN2065_c0_g3_i1.p1  ORF type:complete len:139 (-),score=28.89 TRINITY_DN2065_c0_g3_i1:10-426(-)